MQSYALVTGASSGIGAVFARELRRRRPELGLILTARRRERLEELKRELGGEVVLLTADLASPDSRKALLGEFDRFEIEILVNNAGFGSVGPFLSSDISRQLDMVEVNCRAAAEIAHRVAQGMCRRRSGRIINVASIAGFMPLPGMATYAATKAFLVSFSAALRQELAGTGVTVQALCPGPTESEFHLAAGLERKIDLFSAMTAEAVVRESLDRLESGIVVTGLANRFVTLVARLLPPLAVARVAKRLLRKYLPR